ncbi:MAG: 50S ribosomal protein L13 [Candidatus Riflebacteria bacterium]|nr:50S ribosomal protein L13 [Candidatus Riflebacteria bacterium]
MKTFIMKPADVKREWYLVDAKNQVLGRLAAKVAGVLRGKGKTTFTPNVAMGDFVVVINAGKIILTGNKAEDKYYFHHSGYPGGMKKVSYGDLRAERPELMLFLAVKRMLPRNKTRKHTLRMLKVYSDDKHPHLAQQPKPLALVK